MAKLWTSFKRAYRRRTLGKVERTGRGFEYVRFPDENGKVCSLQQSSWAVYEPPGTSGLWLGFDVTGQRMHLDRTQAEALINHLESWLDYGTLEVRRCSE